MAASLIQQDIYFDIIKGQGLAVHKAVLTSQPPLQSSIVKMKICHCLLGVSSNLLHIIEIS